MCLKTGTCRVEYMLIITGLDQNAFETFVKHDDSIIAEYQQISGRLINQNLPGILTH